MPAIACVITGCPTGVQRAAGGTYRDGMRLHLQFVHPEHVDRVDLSLIPHTNRLPSSYPTH